MTNNGEYVQAPTEEADIDDVLRDAVVSVARLRHSDSNFNSNYHCTLNWEPRSRRQDVRVLESEDEVLLKTTSFF